MGLLGWMICGNILLVWRDIDNNDVTWATIFGPMIMMFGVPFVTMFNEEDGVSWKLSLSLFAILVSASSIANILLKFI
jgi:multisubunit Na+/H+ antiporter MnhG subunit